MTNCCCCCPEPDSEQTVSTSRGTDSTLSETRAAPGLFSQMGIVPNVIQILNPSQYNANEEHERRLEGASKPKCVDTNYPPDPRSDPTALTPVFRGGQNVMLIRLDQETFHGIPVGGVFTPWDGVTRKTVWQPSTNTPEEKVAFRQDWYDFVFPGDSFFVRGLKELYEDVQPFADEYQPTISEFENWNHTVINHLRYLLNLNPATMDQTLFIRQKWADERRTTRMWDEAYPGTWNCAYGPCEDWTNLHCGDTFYPATVAEQRCYWNDVYSGQNVTHPLVTHQSGQVGSSSVWYNGGASTAMSRTLRNWCRTGVISAHGGAAFFFRERYGYSIAGPTANTLRAKWEGNNNPQPPGYEL